MIKKNIQKKGFVVLIAVMVTTIILTVGLGVLNLALREFILANVERDSVKAFYAADTGLECAFNWDIISAGTPKTPYFASRIPGIINPGDPGNPFTLIKCNNQDLHITGSAYQNTTELCHASTDADADPLRPCAVTTLKRSDSNDTALSALCLENGFTSGSCPGACVTVQVKKIWLSDIEQETQITADGINDCDGDRKVERSLVLTWGAKTP